VIIEKKDDAKQENEEGKTEIQKQRIKDRERE
jgi:hypothetical protein